MSKFLAIFQDINTHETGEVERIYKPKSLFSNSESISEININLNQKIAIYSSSSASSSCSCS
ncbi:hypothetical protein BpHYR1_010709 [Brachionus plicatilis]|uniref:Uncharacterized protein n=1 Tax=Brachionus plicatilis TaxID=10195 RepID=A0A3M7SKK4_BRAPC|nr:hypothetical protein BpHYR1_010709 [Brachionus plicatilis]